MAMPLLLHPVVKPPRTRLSALFNTPFFKGSFTYLCGSILNSLLPLALLPVLTRHLTKTDYGIMGTATVLTQILAIIIGLNAYGLVARSYFDDDRSNLRSLLSTSTILSFAVSLGILAVTYVVGKPLELVTEFPSPWMPALVFVSLATVIQTNYLSLIQVRREALRYIAVQTLGGLSNILLSLLFVVHYHMDWRGRMWALIISQAAVALFCLRSFVFRLDVLRPIFSGDSCRQLSSFGVPLIPHAIGGWVMTMSSRIFLNNMASLAATGLYSVAFNLTSPLGMVVGAANNAFMPTLYEMLSRKPECDKVRLCSILLVVALAFPLVAVAGACVVRWALPLLVDPEFYGAADFLIWLALMYAIQGIYCIFGNFVVYSKRTSLMTWRADFLGGAVLLVACPLLIRLNGPVGAAQGACLGFAASALGCMTAARRAYPMPWRQGLASLLGAGRIEKLAA